MLFKYPTIILPETLQLLERLQQDDHLTDFFLVGGTALALQIGHRFSIDLDLFSIKDFDVQQLEDYLFSTYHFKTDYIAKNTLQGFTENIKIDFITHAYPLCHPLIEIEFLRLASIYDIAAMKLNAVAHSGQRLKDFIDVYFLLEKLSLNAILAAYESKYPHSNPIIPLKALTYFEDIQTAQLFPKMIQKVSLKAIKARLVKAVEKPNTVFNLNLLYVKRQK